MRELRLSWTKLNAWSSGRIDEFMMMHEGEEIAQTPVMKEGKRLHKKVAKLKLRLIPELGINSIFEDVSHERNSWVNYFRVPISELLDVTDAKIYLSFVIDVLDPANKILIDWKSGRKRSTEHNKMQLYLYALGLKILGVQIDHTGFAMIDEKDGTIFCRDYSLFKMNQEKHELALNYLQTVGAEIYNYLVESKRI